MENGDYFNEIRITDISTRSKRINSSCTSRIIYNFWRSYYNIYFNVIWSLTNSTYASCCIVTQQRRYAVRSFTRITRSHPRHKENSSSLSKISPFPRAGSIDDPGERRGPLSSEGRVHGRKCPRVKPIQRNFHGHGLDLVTRYRARIRSGWKKKMRPTDTSAKEQPWERNRWTKKKQVIELKRYRAEDGCEACNFYPEANLLAGDIFGSNGISATRGPKIARSSHARIFNPRFSRWKVTHTHIVCNINTNTIFLVIVFNNMRDVFLSEDFSS